MQMWRETLNTQRVLQYVLTLRISLRSLQKANVRDNASSLKCFCNSLNIQSNTRTISQFYTDLPILTNSYMLYQSLWKFVRLQTEQHINRPLTGHLFLLQAIQKIQPFNVDTLTLGTERILSDQYPTHLIQGNFLQELFTNSCARFAANFVEAKGCSYLFCCCFKK